MGFGVSGSTAVIFLGVLIASGTLYTAAAGSAERISDARDTNTEDLLDRQNTELEITKAVYNDPNVEINVTNEGTTTLSVNGTTLLVDNEYVEITSTNVEGDLATDVWGAGQTLVIDASVDEEPKRVTVVAENGITASNSTIEVN
ncbi:fla cluster protein FlaF [Halobellus captivus]|uniref:fla cluster protein FlaF n=1 Tax=Halobellus captivus TaxID=2592614 RepID=UPI00119E22EA|nr:fla cluster protein FlaF [Halobellus captivus]